MDKLEQANENIKDLIDQIIFYEHYIGSMSEGRCSDRFDYTGNDCKDCLNVKKYILKSRKKNI